MGKLYLVDLAGSENISRCWAVCIGILLPPVILASAARGWEYNGFVLLVGLVRLDVGWWRLPGDCCKWRTSCTCLNAD